jgi:mono/diheme cytochrome c family protein
MFRSPLFVGGLACLAVAACQSGPPATVSTPQPAPQVVVADTEPEAEPSTLDGVYTAEQARRGFELYSAECSECHESEDWQEGGFLGRWADQSVYRLWYYINDRMPYDDPWSLSRQQVTDVLTYILELNDLPVGDTELGADDDSIDDYWIVWSR